MISRQYSASGWIGQGGFSLVELSIVLVILGLLTGGILTGQNLIRAAELRSVVTEFQAYQTAVMTFRDQYFALPGDMRNATDFWGAMTSGTCPSADGGVGTETCNGDGDGMIERGSAASKASEIFQFWRQLSNAGLIEGSFSGINGPNHARFDARIGDNVPSSKVSNAGWMTLWAGAITDPGNSHYFTGDYGHIVYFGRKQGDVELMAETVSPVEAWNVDTKLDDGKPNTGKLRSQKPTTSYNPNCVDSGTLTYDLTNDGIACSLMFVRAF